MRSILIAGLLSAMAVPTTVALAQPVPPRPPGGWDRDGPRGPADRYDRDARRDDRRDLRDARRDRRDDWRRYDHNHPDPRYGDYRADRYYRQGNQPARRLAANDRIYRGADNRYYCRRNDGTTGLIVGALGGGVLGNVIAPGGSKTLGTILGGGAGGLLGRSIDRKNVSCR